MLKKSERKMVPKENKISEIIQAERCEIFFLSFLLFIEKIGSKFLFFTMKESVEQKE
jgi:hypothetical protein